ncbi:MAG: ABC transporter permease, partial [Armatimonadetes bacterium]|nr:ABC transporter permease [Armatimonadota bacterium]NIN05770.1 ABC transporter permease [Armatimonadota bacterium]NIO76455.1 ABC transporter permease [Armatimonadota bacterium]
VRVIISTRNTLAGVIKAEVKTFTDLWAYRQALISFVVRNLTVRYKRSLLGFVWSFINPLLMVITYLIVFKYIFPRGEENYSVKLFCTLLAWRFFNATVMDGSATISKRLALIKRVSFPRIILPTASLISNFIDYLLSLTILVIVFLAVRVTVNWPYLALAISALMLQMLFAFGLSLILASLSVFFDDIQFLVGSLFQMWFFLSPVLYPAVWVTDRDLPQIYKTIFFSNPMAPLLMAYRSIVPNEEPTTILPEYYTFLGISAVVAIVTFSVGLFVFKRYESTFAKQV